MHKSFQIQIIWKGVLDSIQFHRTCNLFCFFLFPGRHKTKFRFPFNKTTKQKMMYTFNRIVHILSYSTLCVQKILYTKLARIVCFVNTKETEVYFSLTSYYFMTSNTFNHPDLLLLTDSSFVSSLTTYHCFSFPLLPPQSNHLGNKPLYSWIRVPMGLSFLNLFLL